MKSLLVAITTACALLTAALPVGAQPRPGAAELPVTRIILFNSGVGYFQRQGLVEGDARVDLQFPQDDINDLLKSLILQDAGGGRVGTVTYDNRNPLALTLKSFALDLTANPSLADLLNQARGEKAEIVTAADAKGTTLGQNETLQGVIVGVERQRHTAGKDQVIETAQLNLLTSEGLRGVPLSLVQRVRFLKVSLDQEFRKALEVLATGHDKQKKAVSLHFSGQGKRNVRVGYVTESPVWKTSYRLSLGKDKDKTFLQGWAVVENTSDEDWNNVRLSMVSGRPISFRMDLYQPLFVSRPLVEPELFASLRPQVYGGDLRPQQEGESVGVPGAAAAAPMTPPPPSANGRRGARDGERKLLQDLTRANDDRNGLDFRQGVASAAVATELGEYFQYVLEQPVSLPRQKSALLPIVNQEVAGSSRVSIYNEGVHPKFPLLGLRFKNSTGLHLCQGPITVFEDDAYAGDARIADLQPNETRLLSYAIDLGTEVEPQQKETDTLQGVKLVKGILYATFQRKESKTYTVKNRSPQARTVLLEHPYRSQFKLVSPEKAAERTRDVYRFEVQAEPDKPVTFQVVEELPRVEQVFLSNSNDEQVRVFIRSTAASERVKQALQRALELKAKVNEAQRLIGIEERALKVIEQDQARMRANMERVPQTSEAYKRYLKKFDDQETEIEKRRARIDQLQAEADKERKVYEDFLAALNVG